jgi:NAD(P)H dehydrogenase (quinone)
MPRATSAHPTPPHRVDPQAIEHLIVIGHPAERSFNHALADAYASAVKSCGQSAVIRDLYAAGFDPLLRADERPEAPGFALSDDVKAELALIEPASVIVLVYPIWFGLPPAAIVGYVDRVLGAGLTAKAIRRNEGHPLLAGKRLVLVSTSGATQPWLSQQGQWHGLHEAFDRYLETIFSLDACEHEHFDSIVTPLHPTYAAECLERAGERARMVCSALLAAAHARRRRARLSLFERVPADPV